MTFISEYQGHRDGDGLRWGVDPICAALSEHGIRIAPSTSWEVPSRSGWQTRHSVAAGG